MPDHAKLAKIHIAKKELGLSEESYRDILHLHFQVESAAKLTDRQATVLLNQFKDKGWQSKQPTAGQDSACPRQTKRPSHPSTNSGRSSRYIEIKPGPAAAQQRKVLALWNALGYAMDKLHTRVKTQFGVDRFEWLEDGHALHVLITDLQHRLGKSGGKQ